MSLPNNPIAIQNASMNHSHAIVGTQTHAAMSFASLDDPRVAATKPDAIVTAALTNHQLSEMRRAPAWSSAQSTPATETAPTHNDTKMPMTIAMNSF